VALRLEGAIETVENGEGIDQLLTESISIMGINNATNVAMPDLR
jgi:hypothetical protein